MPNRILRDWTDSAAVNSLSDAAEKFFCRLIQKADDFGRYHGNAKLLRPMLYPMQLDRVREADIQRLISECEKAGLVRLYEAEGKQIMVINKFQQRTRAEKSRFPNPVPANDRHLTDKGPPSARVFGDGDVDGDGGGGGDGQPPPSYEDVATAAAEIPSVEEAIAQADGAGIPPDFVRFVFADWSSRAGKDAAGNVVAWLPYVTKRWARELVEWRAGTHRGRKSSAVASVRPEGVPARAEVHAYVREKWGDDPRHANWAVSFHAHWGDPKRNWQRNGRLIDWKVELTAQIARLRAAP